MKETLANLLNFSGLAWWVKIFTTNPCCTYYFGPFFTFEEAKAAEAGYIEDLKDESAQGIQVFIEQSKPVELTIYDELENSSNETVINPAFSPQT
ncbi:MULTISPECIES: DUF1816 domain-containing protein [Okeania]|uniref:DUF1816 domain-containing protein n=1 Tax=Okeania hirsuta TaxID=1458930 RepID=A0A3N6P388_9CYAN|nr:MULTISPECIES: DUF1816 domain-containing protein [Okeania]NET12722.1 DUF1816 domain-containing protein [Okeania sp. SIO1H6]NEP89072.1 DUF1816 domain-containing protein [Okeania sp. SIO2C2]NES76843.1 DUF1816 domain-containing protein [Okeania sp. SIO1H4]NES90155.1 DUF1816 domain-containing protein [Okeania sp. SIO2B9]NET20472.1 DUF1816 domain-containing protein [Okeania sp. SIO1H5]